MEQISKLFAFLFLILSLSLPVFANHTFKSSYEINKFEISERNKRLVLNFSVNSKIVGSFLYFIHASESILINNLSKKRFSYK